MNMYEKFFNSNYTISMIDIADVIDHMTGRELKYFKRFAIKDDDVSEQFKIEVASNKLKGNAILFAMVDDIKLWDDFTVTLHELNPRLNITSFFPMKIHGEFEKYVELFVFD